MRRDCPGQTGCNHGNHGLRAHGADSCMAVCSPALIQGWSTAPSQRLAVYAWASLCSSASELLLPTVFVAVVAAPTGTDAGVVIPPQVKAQLEDVHGEVVQLQQANARLGADLAGRTAELEQLKTLSIAGHTTLQEYTGKLKVGGGASMKGGSCCDLWGFVYTSASMFANGL